MTIHARYPACAARAVFFPGHHPHHVECQLPDGHRGMHRMDVAQDVSYRWRDDELPTSYPPNYDPPTPKERHQ